MICDMEIEQGLAFARARLAKRLNDDADSPDAADLALAILALVAARDARKRERPAILKMNDFSAPRSHSSRFLSDDSAPATINFEKAAAALSRPRVSATQASLEPRAASNAVYPRLYRGD